MANIKVMLMIRCKNCNL